MKKTVTLALGLTLTTALVAAAALRTTSAAPAATSHEPAQELAAANWLHVGCIQLNGNCYDVFQDNKGDWWVCEECFTTQNPNPGKCRRLTPFEIANALWCA